MYSQRMFLKVLLSKKHAAWHHLYRPAHRSACAIWLSLWCSWAFFLVTIRLMSLVLENRKNRAWIKTIVYLYSSKHERCRWIRCCCNLQNDCGCLVDWQDNLLPHPQLPFPLTSSFRNCHLRVRRRDTVFWWSAHKLDWLGKDHRVETCWKWCRCRENIRQTFPHTTTLSTTPTIRLKQTQNGR